MGKQVFESREELANQIEVQLQQAKAAFANLKALGDELGALSKANVKEGYYVNEDDKEDKYDSEGYKRPGHQPCSCCQNYPCKCKECDYLKTKALGQWELGFYALEQAWNTLGLAEEQFEDGVEALEEAIALFINASKCTHKYDCDDYCKKPPCSCC